MFSPTHIREAWRIYRRSCSVKKRGWHRYEGTAEEICQKIVKACWNGTFFQTSKGHFCEFYMRDFGICVDALMNLNYKEEVHKTLQYALNIYSSNRIITTTITPNHKPVQMFAYSPDSLPFLLRSLRIAKADDLIQTYKPFIEEQVNYYHDYVFDTEKILIRKGNFSSMKDNHARKSCCYDNVMLAMLKEELTQSKLTNPFSRYKIEQSIKDNFWSKSYFYDDLRKGPYVAGDANVFPFWCKVFKDKEMIKSGVKAIQEAGLDTPWPLKYTGKKESSTLFFPMNLIIPDYETDPIWMNLGLCYLDVLKDIDKNKTAFHLNQYKDLIEKQKNFLELYDRDGSVYQHWNYLADESMLWAAKYLELIRN
jgi:hypothetical protein